MWRRLCLALPLSLSTSRFFPLLVRLHGKTLKSSLRYLPLALDRIFEPQEHNQNVRCASFVFFVRVDGILNIQHT